MMSFMLILLLCMSFMFVLLFLYQFLVHASVPGTGGPAAVPPPASNNKAPATQPGANEVYLVWDDEAMSMVYFPSSL